MNAIQSFVLSKVTGKRKHTPSDWLSFNAVCCPHNGESMDKKKRGGVILSEEGGIAYHCFNCGFKTSWQPGRPLSFKFKNLLKWMSVSDDEINWLRLEILKTNKDSSVSFIPPKEEFVFESRALPPEARTIKEWNTFYQLSNKWPKDFLDVIVYAYDRKIDLVTTELYWSPGSKENPDMGRRLIFPIYYQKRLHGYSARSIDNKKPKYLTNHPPHMVFNYDAQTYDRKFVIVTEGMFDAVSLDCIAIMTNEVSEKQAKLINQLNKKVIIVPHWDNPGRKLIEAAIINNWSLSTPVWQTRVKDINECVVKYGKLFTMKTILDNVIDNPIRIQLYLKGLS